MPSSTTSWPPLCTQRWKAGRCLWCEAACRLRKTPRRSERWVVVISRSYIARPAISEKRLSLSPQRKVPYQLKTPWKNGTTHVEFEPVELMAHIPVRHPAGDLRSSKSAILPICHR